MKQRIILILLTLSIAGTSCIAQNEDYKWGIGIHPSTFSFYAKYDSSFLDVGEYEHGVQFSANRYLNSLFDVGIEASSAILRHPAGENNPANGGLWRDFFYDVNPFIKVKANNGFLLKKNSFVMPFFKAGIGVNKYRTGEMGISAPIGVGLGLKFKEAGYLVAQSSYKLGVANSNSYLHHSLGFVVNLKGGNYRKKSKLDQVDSDNDGIPDHRDECPKITAKNKTGCPDMDGDGVKDSDDLCPGKKGLVNLRGCQDRDKDGIPDPLDKCPNKFGFQESGGCPFSVSDKDNDLIEDKDDECPTLPGHWSGKGCPDRDSDGILDKSDNCPDLFGEAKYNGCPFNEQGMKDFKDGYAPNGVTIFIDEEEVSNKSIITTTEEEILNRTVITDKPTTPFVQIDTEKTSPVKKPKVTLPNNTRPSTTIPNTPIPNTSTPIPSTSTTSPTAPSTTMPNTPIPNTSTPTPSANKDAIPCDLPTQLLTSAGQAIRFETDKATLTADSKAVLNRIATLLKPCSAKLIIRAHTDSDGDDEFDLRLSERRAQSVSRYLIIQGLDRKYIETSGAGSTEPIGPNTSIEGKALNRRIELKVIPR